MSFEYHSSFLHSPVAGMADPLTNAADRDSNLPKTSRFFCSFSSARCLCNLRISRLKTNSTIQRCECEFQATHSVSPAVMPDPCSLCCNWLLEKYPSRPTHVTILYIHISTRLLSLHLAVLIYYKYIRSV